MNISLKNLPKSQVELTIEIADVEMGPHLSRAAQDISTELNIAGFRPGKAPYELVEKRVGAMRILQQAAEYAVQATFPEAIRTHKLITIGSPKIDIDKIAPGNPFVYRAVVALLPETKLGSYRSLKAKRKPVVVEPKDVDETIDNIRRMYGKEKPVERKARKGDKVEIDLDIFRDNVPIDGGAAKNHPVIIGESRFIPGFEEHLINMAKDEKKEFKLTFPKDYHQKNLADKEVQFKVTVKGVHEIELPPLDDAFAALVAQAEKMEDLRKRIEENVRMEKMEKEQQRLQLALLDEVIDGSKFGDIPESLLHNELDRMIHELKEDVEHRGMKFEDYLSSIKKNEEELRQGMVESAEHRIKSALAIRAISEENKIEVSENEITEEIKLEKERHAGHTHDMKTLDTPAYRDYLRTILTNRKVLTLLESFIT
ncbi:MAG: trigger factor [Patescibacteria group bacterium]|jgi:trigger factor